MKTGRIEYENIKPGTAEAHADIHLGLYGSTNKIPLSKNLPELIERVQKIGDMLDDNRKSIESLNETLSAKDYMAYVNLFNKHEEIRSEIRFKFQVRQRLLRMFQKAVRELTFIS